MRDQPHDIDSATAGRSTDEPDWSQMARTCFEASQSWLNSSRRAAWNDSLRQFQSEHPLASKYRSTDYRYRSRLFRPKSRSIVRRSEAATAAAFFSTSEVVSISARDDDDPKQKASADVMKELIQIRLTANSESGGIPWFLTVIGARQDTEVMGAAVNKIYWKYSERLKSSHRRPALHAETGEPLLDDEGQPIEEQVDTYERQHDKPVIDSIPLENFRVDPGCDWRDPVGTSPYIIHRIPMYVVDVRQKMDDKDPKTGQPIWKWFDDETIGQAREMDNDTTRRVRETDRQDSKDTTSSKPREYDIVWIHENIIRHGGEDYQYYTLGRAGKLLTDPTPASEVYWHDPRPFVFGIANIETHKVYPASKMELVKPLQMQANETVNLRLDALKLSLNPRQKVKKGAGVDLSDVRTFMPGKTILLNDPTSDLVWEEAPPLQDSSYQEQDRVNADFDELAGSNAAMPGIEDFAQVKATGLDYMSAAAGAISDYELNIFAATWAEPVLKKLIRLEQKYESDATILAIAGQKAQIVQKYGIDQITDELLDQELTVRVNVGIGATDPQRKLQNFLTGAKIIGQIYGPSATQGTNFEAISSEVFGLLGYKDGARFFQPNFDPRVAQLQQQIQQMQQKGGARQVDTPNDMALTKIKEFEVQHQAAIDQTNAQHKAFLDAAEAFEKRKDAETAARENEGKRHFELEKLSLEVRKLEIERARIAADLSVKEAQLELDERKFGVDQAAVQQPIDLVQQATQALTEHISNIGNGLSQRLDEMAQVHGSLGHGMLAVVNHLNAPKQVIRDDQGNAVGLQHLPHAGESDLGSAIGKLGAPRSLSRGPMGEIQGTS